jgi:hypothetical protein
MFKEILNRFNCAILHKSLISSTNNINIRHLALGVETLISTAVTFINFNHFFKIINSWNPCMITKRTIALSLLLALMINKPSLSSPNQPGIIYHCPSIQDIKYENGSFKSTTTYNGVTIDWFSSQRFPEANPSIKKFNFTNYFNDCSDGTCQIYCVYALNNHDVLRFFVTNQSYRFLQSYSGPWSNRSCTSNNPDICTFSVVSNRELLKKPNGIHLGV